MAKNKKTEKKVKSKANIWPFVVVGLIAAFLVLFMIYNYYSANFKYLDLDFNKVRFGNLLFFHAKIPLANQAGEIVSYYDLYIRNDPRELENIPINGDIKLKTKVIMASDEIKCEDNGIAGGELGGILGLWTKVIQGTTNETLAEEKDLKYATCNPNEMVYLDTSVLVFKPGNETMINQKTKDCYEISVNDCEILKAVERFILGLYANSKGLNIP